MTETSSIQLPVCGLYRTTRPLPGAEAEVGEGALVNFHNHSTPGMPVVLRPAFNVFNRWSWNAEPIYVRQLSWLDSLHKLPAEGYYALRRELEFDDGSARWPKGALVQLGYDRKASPLVFLAQLRHALSENTLWFAEHGVILREDQIDLLEPLSVFEEPDPVTAGGERPAGA